MMWGNYLWKTNCWDKLSPWLIWIDLWGQKEWSKHGNKCVCIRFWDVDIQRCLCYYLLNVRLYDHNYTTTYSLLYALSGMLTVVHGSIVNHTITVLCCFMYYVRPWRRENDQLEEKMKLILTPRATEIIVSHSICEQLKATGDVS